MTSPHRLYTPEEYLALDADAESRSEYVNGRIYAMAGAEPNHEQIVLNVSGLLYAGIRGRLCRAFGSNMRVKVQASGMYTYPDVSGLCGRAEFEPSRPQTLLNPSFIVEVLSRSTEGYDRGAKFAHYQLIPSLAEYVLVSQDHRRVERYLRSGASWQFDQFTRPDDIVMLASIECALRVSDVYEHIEVPDGPPPLRVREEEVPAWGVAS